MLTLLAFVALLVLLPASSPLPWHVALCSRTAHNAIIVELAPSELASPHKLTTALWNGIQPASSRLGSNMVSSFECKTPPNPTVGRPKTHLLRRRWTPQSDDALTREVRHQEQRHHCGVDHSPTAVDLLPLWMRSGVARLKGSSLAPLCM